MEDLRNYKDTVRAAVLEERKADAYYSWRVIAVTKDTVKIGWSYLDYNGGTEPFTVTIFDEGSTLAVVGHVPNGEEFYFFIGPERWDDCKTIKEGIAQAIHSMASYAHLVY